MEINFLAVLVSAFVPTVLGFIWYNEKVFGKPWAAGAGMTEEKMKSGNMPLIFGLSFLFSFVLAFSMNMHAVHDAQVQGAMYYATDGTMEPEAGSELAQWYEYFETNLAPDNHVFTHGAAHGMLLGLLLLFPIIINNGLFERRGWKYILINGGYWTITLIIIGGILAVWR
jgi:hypothetical protein